MYVHVIEHVHIYIRECTCIYMFSNFHPCILCIHEHVHVYICMPLFVWVGINFFLPTILIQLVRYAHVFPCTCLPHVMAGSQLDTCSVDITHTYSNVHIYVMSM